MSLQLHPNSKPDAIYGINFRITDPVLCDKNRWKSNVYILDPRPDHQYASTGNPKPLEMRQVLVTGHDKAVQAAKNMRHTLLEAHAGDILSWMADGQYSTASMALYWYLRSDEIQRKGQWLANADTYYNLWITKLCKHIAAKSITDMADKDALIDFMDKITKYSHKKIIPTKIVCAGSC